MDKNRNGERRTITIKADFESGRFEVNDAPYITSRKDELATLEQIIQGQPGIGYNAIWKASGIQRNRLQRLLAEGCGALWHMPGTNRAKLYHPGKNSVVQVVRRTMGGTSVPPDDQGKTLP